MKCNKKSKSGEKNAFEFSSVQNPGLARYLQGLPRFVGGGVAKDDILDALVAAVTARVDHDRLKTIPDCPPKDCKGLPMEMVYYKPQGCPTLAHADMTDSG